MQHVKDTLAHPGCSRAAIKYYTALLSLQSLRVMFSRCNVPALQVAGLSDGCMGAGVRIRICVHALALRNDLHYCDWVGHMHDTTLPCDAAGLRRCLLARNEASPINTK